MGSAKPARPLYTPQLFWTPVSLLTGERVLKLDRLSSVKPPFFHSLAAFDGERVEEWTGGGVSACFKSQNLGSCQTSWHGAKALSSCGV